MAAITVNGSPRSDETNQESVRRRQLYTLRVIRLAPPEHSRVMSNIIQTI